jgi:hypothetical protein
LNQFYVGQEVVCIDAKFSRVTIPQGITEGQIYKIRWIGEFTTYVDGTYIGVRLDGVERGVDPTYGYEDPPFAARRFRPLVSDPLIVFRQIANDPDFEVGGPEGPSRERVKEREKEEVK